jgi:hypothetical protein
MVVKMSALLETWSLPLLQSNLNTILKNDFIPANRPVSFLSQDILARQELMPPHPTKYRIFRLLRSNEKVIE